MGRTARLIVPETPHHIVQRGNRSQDVFFEPYDRVRYLGFLKNVVDKYHVEIICYCLMKNHIHLIAVPSEESSLASCFRQAHSQYARIINKRFDWSGHLWQDRFHSSPLDPAYLYNAVRYVLQNPVRAGICESAWDYKWSSAAFHTGDRNFDLLVENNDALSDLTDNWKDYLSIDLETVHMLAVRKAAKMNKPLGKLGTEE